MPRVSRGSEFAGLRVALQPWKMDLGGEKVTVVKGKKEVVVVSYGRRPFYYDKQGCIIPDGFTAETFVAGHTFIATTKVNSQGRERPYYRFNLKEDERVTSGWQNTPTGALDAVNRALNNTRHKYGTNGRLMIGVTYDAVQERIRQVFDEPSQKPASSKRYKDETNTESEAEESDDDEKTPKSQRRTLKKKASLQSELSASRKEKSTSPPSSTVSNRRRAYSDAPRTLKRFQQLQPIEQSAGQVLSMGFRPSATTKTIIFGANINNSQTSVPEFSSQTSLDLCGELNSQEQDTLVGDLASTLTNPIFAQRCKEAHTLADALATRFGYQLMQIPRERSISMQSTSAVYGCD